MSFWNTESTGQNQESVKISSTSIPSIHPSIHPSKPMIMKSLDIRLLAGVEVLKNQGFVAFEYRTKIPEERHR